MKTILTILLIYVLLFVFPASTVFAQHEGKAIVDRECSKCHTLNRVYSANKKAAGWEKTLDLEIKRGAQIRPQDRDLVLKYLNTLNR